MNIRSKILKEEEEQKDSSNFNKTSKYSSVGFKGNKTEGNNEAMQSGIIKKRIRKIRNDKKAAIRRNKKFNRL